MSTTLKAILDKYPDAVRDFILGFDLSEFPSFYEDLFQFYSSSGEMPYGTMKARTGDPFNWISDKLNLALSGVYF
jgi:hypothetical protein